MTARISLLANSSVSTWRDRCTADSEYVYHLAACYYLSDPDGEDISRETSNLTQSHNEKNSTSTLMNQDSWRHHTKSTKVRPLTFSKKTVLPDIQKGFKNQKSWIKTQIKQSKNASVLASCRTVHTVTESKTYIRELREHCSLPLLYVRKRLFLSPEFTKFHGSPPGPAGGAYSAPPYL